MRDRALALLRWLRAGSYVSWTPGTIDLIFDGMEIWGSNLLDLVCHVMRQCRTQPMTHGSPGPPPGFTTLRHTNASPELVRYRWCLPQIYSCVAASMHTRPYDKGDNDDDYTEDMLERSAVAGVSMDDEEMGEEEAKAGRNGSATPEGGDDDNNDNHDNCEQGEDTYKMPARSDIINIIISAVARKKKTSPPPCRTCVTVITERARQVAWLESPSCGQAWAGTLPGRPSGKPWPLKLHAAPPGVLPFPLMADHHVQAGRTAAVGLGGLHRVPRGQWWHQVSFLLHRHILQVCLAMASDEPVRHWDGGCHAGHSGRDGRPATAGHAH